ncbi:hypothetical protein MM239_13220 [Belliella sp. DSM 111904]|uniref:Curlin associated repeat-containing protein n=1 Tax=Belliella filtrata TaxID=2923435 RepID=A0ABS9V1Q8_9BACT|nr:hypothetical protein [Belliella filtrata]MCH7410362.1 hypothetical protein [Belliella filtrata]
MKQASSILVLAWIFMLSGNVFAQQTVEVLDQKSLLELNAIEAIHIDVDKLENVAQIQQVGNQNTASIFQTPQVLQLGNFAQINQKGNLNIGFINQQGFKVSSRVSQSGNANVVNINTIGDNISVATFQSGNNNRINTSIENSGLATRYALLEQNGNNNQINLDFLNNPTILGNSSIETVRVSQSGNQQGLNLRLDDASSPVEVVQRPGAGGQGMQVNITTSAFPIR